MGSKIKESDVIGKKFNMLTAIKLINSKPRIIDGRQSGYNHMFLWKCDCGQEKVMRYSDVKSSHSRSCGCLMVKSLMERSYKHGHARKNKISPTFVTWCSMIERCTIPGSSTYHKYGAVGVKVCDEWQGDDGFNVFLSDMGERPDGHTIDRIDGSKGYYPNNCRWATPLMQANNQKSNVKVNINGVDMNVSEAMRHYGIYTKSGVYYTRLQRGWTVDDTFNTPIKKKGKL